LTHGDRYLPGQLELAGTAPISDADLAKHLAAEMLRPAVPQRACDHGLFSDAAAQTDLVEAARRAG
jgi:hypothetical protein